MTEPTSYLLAELAQANRELRELRSRVRHLTASRDHWKREAKAWKWGCMERHAARRGEDAQTSGRAEAS